MTKIWASEFVSYCYFRRVIKISAGFYLLRTFSVPTNILPTIIDSWLFLPIRYSLSCKTRSAWFSINIPVSGVEPECCWRSSCRAYNCSLNVVYLNLLLRHITIGSGSIIFSETQQLIRIFLGSHSPHFNVGHPLNRPQRIPFCASVQIIFLFKAMDPQLSYQFDEKSKIIYGGSESSGHHVVWH